jgi:hypothetical protein
VHGTGGEPTHVRSSNDRQTGRARMRR